MAPPFAGRLPGANEIVAVPLYVVWEVTLACNLKCRHCGSRAGQPRHAELSTPECLDVIDQLAELGTREITLIGGEAYLRADWLDLVRAIAGRGMLAGLQTGARALTETKIAAAAEAGLRAAGVSLDGPEALHDELRGVPGSFRQAVAALAAMRRHGLTASVNTQINARSLPHLEEMLALVAEAGARAWQVQLTTAMGAAADRPELLLQPFQVLDLMPRLARLFDAAERLGVRIQPGNNIGYFGPHEYLMRSLTGRPEHYSGCGAGIASLGLEADGTVKGCPSLPTAPYAGGSVRDRRLSDIWADTRAATAFRRNAAANRGRLWGYCRTCYYADTCGGGCTWTAHVLTGRPGNNPFCHHRALALAARGWRERIEPREAAPGRPFDHGRHDIIVEDERGRRFGQEVFDDWPALGRPGELVPCPGCRSFVRADEVICLVCGSDPHGPTLADRVATAQTALADLAATLARVGRGAPG